MNCCDLCSGGDQPGDRTDSMASAIGIYSVERRASKIQEGNTNEQGCLKKLEVCSSFQMAEWCRACQLDTLLHLSRFSLSSA